MKHKTDDITKEQLKQLLWYHPDTGVFRWRNAKNNWKIRPWDAAGSPDDQGYLKIMIERRSYRAHRLAWIYMTGEKPPAIIDHINMVKDDNRWGNLRAADASSNQWNREARSDSSSGVSGVWFCATNKRWKAACKVRGKRHYLGTFSTKEEAAEVIKQFRSEHHGEFARHQ